MEYAQKRASPLLAQILAQMQQTQQFQPQSYGALAAGLGAQAINQNSLNKLMQYEQAQRVAQSQALSQAMGQFGQESAGGPVNMPSSVIDEGGTRQSRDIRLDTLPDPAGARNNLLASLIGNEHPMAQAGAQALFGQMISPKTEDSPFAKINPKDFTQESVAAFQAGGGKDFSTLKPTPEASTLPVDIRVAQWLYPNDDKKQREYVAGQSNSELPAQIQLALWATNNDQDKAREIVRKNIDGKDSVSFAAILAPALQKMASGQQLSQGEKEALSWYKTDPFTGLAMLLRELMPKDKKEAADGTTVTE